MMRAAWVGWLAVVCLAGPVSAASTVEAAPAGPTAAIFDLKAEVGVDQSVARLLSEAMVAEVRRVGTFSRVISSSEVEGMLGVERQRQMLSCDQESCVTELAGALGADFLLLGTVGKLGESALLSVKLIRSKDSVVVATATKRVGSQQADALLDAVAVAVDEVLATASFLQGGAKLHVARNSGEQEGKAEGGGPKMPLLGAGGGAAAVGLVGLLVSVLVGVAAAGVVVVPYFILAVPTPGLSPALRENVFLVAGGALGVVAVLGAVVGLLLAGGGVAGVAAAFAMGGA